MVSERRPEIGCRQGNLAVSPAWRRGACALTGLRSIAPAGEAPVYSPNH